MRNILMLKIQLRGEFLAKYGSTIFPDRLHKVVLGISLLPNAFKGTMPEEVYFRTTLWRDICSLPSHPLAMELSHYSEWKTANSRLKSIRQKSACPSLDPAATHLKRGYPFE